MGMGIKSDTETVMYLWNYGVFRSTLDGRIRSSEQCQPGDPSLRTKFFMAYFWEFSRVMFCPTLLKEILSISVDLFTGKIYKGYLVNEIVQLKF